MTDLHTPTFHASNLPDASVAWGRDLVDYSKAVGSEVVQLNQSLRNSQRATGGQLAVLSEQIDNLFQVTEDIQGVTSDLSGREGFFDVKEVNLNFTSSTTRTEDSVGLSFSIDRPRKVRISAQTDVRISASAPVGNLGAFHLSISLGGTELPTTQVSRGFVATSASGGGYAAQSISANTLLTLNAGEYLVNPHIRVNIVGSAPTNLGSLSVMVDVLQP